MRTFCFEGLPWWQFVLIFLLATDVADSSSAAVIMPLSAAKSGGSRSVEAIDLVRLAWKDQSWSLLTQLERQALYKQLTAAYSIVVNLAAAVNEIMTAIKYLLRLEWWQDLGKSALQEGPEVGPWDVYIPR